MNPIADVVTGLAGPLFGLVDKLFTSDDERAAAKLKILELEQSGELERVKISMSAILAEANSTDPWTSRARPSFLYVIYVFILAAIPFGFLFAFVPASADAVVVGVKAWLDAIPEAMWTVFGVGYLGYSGARSFEKMKGLTK